MISDARLGASRVSSRGAAVRNLAAFLSAIFVLGSLVVASPARTADDPAITAEPRKVITDAVVRIVAILEKRDESSESRVRQIEEIAYEIFDFTTMSKLVMARNWRKMETQQRAEFVGEFKRHLSRTYGTRLDRYNQEEVEVYAAQVEVRNDVSIKTRIIGGQFDDAEVAYRLRKRKDRWRIIDVVIEGVSLVSNYRSQFAEVLNSGTIEDLLGKLREKNFVVESEKGEKSAKADSAS